MKVVKRQQKHHTTTKPRKKENAGISVQNDPLRARYRPAALKISIKTSSTIIGQNRVSVSDTSGCFRNITPSSNYVSVEASFSPYLET